MWIHHSRKTSDPWLVVPSGRSCGWISVGSKSGHYLFLSSTFRFPNGLPGPLTRSDTSLASCRPCSLRILSVISALLSSFLTSGFTAITHSPLLPLVFSPYPQSLLPIPIPVFQLLPSVSFHSLIRASFRHAGQAQENSSLCPFQFLRLPRRSFILKVRCP
jgi:hypothetical protein